MRAISREWETGSRRTRMASTALKTSVVPPSAAERISTVTIAKVRSLNIPPSIGLSVRRPGRAFLEEQRREHCEVPPPYHPGVSAGRLDFCCPNVFRLQPFAKLAVGGNQAIVSAAGDPQQM